MSAFIVDKNHIDYIVSCAQYYGLNNACYFNGFHEHTNDEIGQILWDENHRSVDFRYSEFNNRDVYKFSYNVGIKSATQFLKAIECLIYQSNETPDWKDSHACYLLDRMKTVAITHLPNYDSLQWEVVT